MRYPQGKSLKENEAQYQVRGDVFHDRRLCPVKAGKGEAATAEAHRPVYTGFGRRRHWQWSQNVRIVRKANKA